MAKTAPVLSSLNLVLRDMDATVAFYRTLGLEIPDGIAWKTDSGKHHIELKMPNGFGLDFDSEALAKVYDAGWTGGAPNRNVMTFSVETREAVDSGYADMTGAGYNGLQEPYDAFWGARYAIIEDPDGNHVGLMSPIDPTKRGAPPAV